MAYVLEEMANEIRSKVFEDVKKCKSNIGDINKYLRFFEKKHPNVKSWSVDKENGNYLLYSPMPRLGLCNMGVIFYMNGYLYELVAENGVTEVLYFTGGDYLNIPDLDKAKKEIILASEVFGCYGQGLFEPLTGEETLCEVEFVEVPRCD